MHVKQKNIHTFRHSKNVTTNTSMSSNTNTDADTSISSNTNTSIGLVVIEGLEGLLLQCCTSVHGEPPFDY